jgi:hypothetical protein
MDERLVKALDVANYMVTFNNQRELLKHEYKENLIYHHNGFKFTVTLELINFIYVINSMEIEEIVLIDDNQNPCSIDNVSVFKDNIFDVYFRATNLYYENFNKLKKQRSITKLILE